MIINSPLLSEKKLEETLLQFNPKGEDIIFLPIFFHLFSAIVARVGFFSSICYGKDWFKIFNRET